MTQEEKWERNYNLLVDYYKEHGDINVPREYTVNGVKLGIWISHLRSTYKGRGASKLTPERINKLNELNMVWERHEKHSFDFYYQLLEKYYQEHGDINVPIGYVVDGIRLGEWLSRLRHSYKNGNNQNLTQSELDKLNKLGITWEIRNTYSFDYYYALLKDYFKEYGDINVPFEYVTNDGVILGRWLSTQREAYKNRNKNNTITLTHIITQEEIDKLEELGIVWSFFHVNWTKCYKLALEYYEKYGNIDIPYNYVINDVYLGYWLNVQRQLYNENKSKFPKTRIVRLNQLGIDWNEKTTELLKEEIIDMDTYNSILIDRINNELEDFIVEGKNKIRSNNNQKEMEKELIKRIWR